MDLDFISFFSFEFYEDVDIYQPKDGDKMFVASEKMFVIFLFQEVKAL